MLDVAEFFVLRRYRRSGVGRSAAFLIWKHFPGTWTVRRVRRESRGARVLVGRHRRIHRWGR